MSEGSSEGGDSGHSDAGHDSSESSHAADNPDDGHNAKEESGDEKSDDRGDDTIHGSVAIIYYEDPETGKVEFYLEEKPGDYWVPEYAGRLAFFGGTIKNKESNLEALVRELGEEVVNKDAQSELIRALFSREPSVYEIIKHKLGFEESRTYVRVIKLNSKEAWEKVRNSPSGHDAGPARVLTLEQIVDILDREENGFAFDFGRILMKFINQFYGAKVEDYKAKLSADAAQNHQNDFGYMPDASAHSGHAAAYASIEPQAAGHGKSHNGEHHLISSYWNPKIAQPFAVNTNFYCNSYPVHVLGNAKLEEMVKQNSYFKQNYY